MLPVSASLVDHQPSSVNSCSSATHTPQPSEGGCEPAEFRTAVNDVLTLLMAARSRSTTRSDKREGTVMFLSTLKPVGSVHERWLRAMFAVIDATRVRFLFPV